MLRSLLFLCCFVSTFAFANCLEQAKQASHLVLSVKGKAKKIDLIHPIAEYSLNGLKSFGINEEITYYRIYSGEYYWIGLTQDNCRVMEISFDKRALV